MANSQFVPAPFSVPANFSQQLMGAADLIDAGMAAMGLAQTVMERIAAVGYSSEYQYVTYIIFAKALKTANAAQILCRTGFGSDGLSLCAVLFENQIDVLYIGQAPSMRARRYFQFQSVELYYQARKVLKAKRLPKGRRIAYKRYEAKLFPQVKPLLKYFKNEFGGWAQKSLFKRAKAVKAELAYNELYWIFCGHKHTLPMVAGTITETTDDGYISAISGPSIKGVCNAAEYSALILLQLCRAVDRIFNLSLSNEIEAAQSALQASVENLRRTQPHFFT